MIARACLVACALLVGIQPARATDGFAVRVLERYLDALHDRRYVAAYALLANGDRAYYRNAANFASGFVVDDNTLVRYHIAEVHLFRDNTVVVVRERLAVRDPARDARAFVETSVPYVLHGAGGDSRVSEAGRPWRAYAVDASNTASGLRVRVRTLAYYERTVRVVVQMQNDGPGFVTLLPYGRSSLRDGAHVYHPLAGSDARFVDRQLVLGVRLAPHTRYTGALAFATPPLDDRARTFALRLGPAVRDGAALPVAIDVAPIAPKPG